MNPAAEAHDWPIKIGVRIGGVQPHFGRQIDNEMKNKQTAVSKKINRMSRTVFRSRQITTWCSPKSRAHVFPSFETPVSGGCSVHNGRGRLEHSTANLLQGSDRNTSAQTRKPTHCPISRGDGSDQLHSEAEGAGWCFGLEGDYYELRVGSSL